MTSALAMRAVMAAAAGDNNPLDRSVAHQAGLGLPAVNSVLELKEALLAVGVNIVTDGRSAESDSLVQHLFEGGMQPSQVIAGERGGASPGPDAGTEQRLISVDVADSTE